MSRRRRKMALWDLRGGNHGRMSPGEYRRHEKRLRGKTTWSDDRDAGETLRRSGLAGKMPKELMRLHLANSVREAARMTSKAITKLGRNRVSKAQIIAEVRRQARKGGRPWTKARRGSVKRMGGRTYVSAGFGAWNDSRLLKGSKNKRPYRRNPFEHNLSHHAHVSRATGMIPMPYDRLEAGDTSCAKGYTRLGFSRVCAPKKSSYQAKREMYDEDWAERAMTPNRGHRSRKSVNWRRIRSTPSRMVPPGALPGFSASAVRYLRTAAGRREAPGLAREVEKMLRQKKWQRHMKKPKGPQGFRHPERWGRKARNRRRGW